MSTPTTEKGNGGYEPPLMHKMWDRRLWLLLNIQITLLPANLIQLFFFFVRAIRANMPHKKTGLFYLLTEPPQKWLLWILPWIFSRGCECQDLHKNRLWAFFSRSLRFSTAEPHHRTWTRGACDQADLRVLRARVRVTAVRDPRLLFQTSFNFIFFFWRQAAQITRCSNAEDMAGLRGDWKSPGKMTGPVRTATKIG